MSEKNKDLDVLAQQVAYWTRERDRLNDLIAHATGHPAEAQQSEAVATLYVECNECSECGHVGLNDHHPENDACGYPCGWSGPSPVEDKCPGCAREGTMCSACPKCGAYYRLLAGADLAVTAAPIAPAPSHHSGDAEERVACKGRNCGCTDGVSHSLECQAEHAAAIAGGSFIFGKPVAWVYRYRDGDLSTRIFFLEPDESEIAEHRAAGGDIVPLYAAPSNRGGEAESEPIGYINERTLSVLADGTTSCTHISPKKTEFQQVAIYTEPRK